MVNIKCVCCDSTEWLVDIRINVFDGFCHSSRNVKICYDCQAKNTKYTKVGEFLVINKIVYHSVGGDSYERVESERHLDRIFNKDYYELLGYFR